MEKTIKINEQILTKLDFRYHFYNTTIDSRIRGVRSKTLVDSMYPARVALGISRNETIPLVGDLSQGYAISELVAKDMGAKKLHISELITMLGYTKTDISKLLQSVKNKELYLTLVGVGGSGSNFLHWLYEMAEWTGKNQIFQYIYAFDNDDFDIPNLLRIPFIPESIRTGETKKVMCLPLKFRILTQNLFRKAQWLTPNNIQSAGSAQRTIVYGAPDIETRSWLSASEYTFIAATHRDSEFSLVENPAVDDELMMETYGKITLSKFFLNHLTMTINFLAHLRDRDRPIGTTEEHEILRANFDEKYKAELKDGFKAGAKKLYAATGDITEIAIEGEGI